MTKNITPSNLANFYGSEQLFFHPLFKAIKYTDGVRFLMHNGAAWLVEAILSHAIHNPKVSREEFVVATLKVDQTKKAAVLSFDDGNDHVLATQVVEYTDFPLPEITFYAENGVLMLPSER
jgi:hypothetical protein